MCSCEDVVRYGFPQYYSGLLASVKLGLPSGSFRFDTGRSKVLSFSIVSDGSWPVVRAGIKRRIAAARPFPGHCARIQFNFWRRARKRSLLQRNTRGRVDGGLAPATSAAPCPISVRRRLSRIGVCLGPAARFVNPGPNCRYAVFGVNDAACPSILRFYLELFVG